MEWYFVDRAKHLRQITKTVQSLLWGLWCGREPDVWRVQLSSSGSSAIVAAWSSLNYHLVIRLTVISLRDGVLNWKTDLEIEQILFPSRRKCRRLLAPLKALSGKFDNWKYEVRKFHQVCRFSPKNTWRLQEFWIGSLPDYNWGWAKSILAGSQLMAQFWAYCRWLLDLLNHQLI